MTGKVNLLVLYGSQTGCAQEVAEHIGRLAVVRAFDVDVRGLDEFDMVPLPRGTG